MGISDTSSLVLLLAGDAIHTSKGAKTYLKSLDLGTGRNLFKVCNSIWEHYGEVIRNRKHCILNMARHAIEQGITQVVILGAGFDALSLELVHHYEKLRVYEVDAANMSLKEDLVRRADALLGSRIRCMDADLQDPAGLVDALALREWSCNKPSLVILEGISYYLSARDLSGLLRAFENGGQNRLLLEYLLPHDCIAEDRSDIPAAVFGAIQSRYGVPLSRYDSRAIASMTGHKMRVARVFGMREMEAARIGRNVHFGGDRSWWIQVCDIRA